MVTWVAWFVAIGMLAGGFLLGVVAMSLAHASKAGDRMHEQARRQQVLELVARLQAPLPLRQAAAGGPWMASCMEPGCGYRTAELLDQAAAIHDLKTHRFAVHGQPWGS